MAIYTCFIQHVINSLKENSGKGAIVIPTGFITAKSGIENKILKHIVDKKIVYGCVSMPSNVFANTGTQFQNGKNTQQLVEQNSKNKFGQQVADQIWKDIISIPWGHHMLLIDKFLSNPEKALFYVHQTVENGWSRNMLLNFIGTRLYERQGKALTNFKQALPSEDSDLAQELTKDPYCFGFTGITKPYNERILKNALLNNITTFLTELGTGFAYVGKEYRLKIGKKENFIDLLFYNLNLSCYIVIEVKIGTFTFADVSQLGGYVVACNHILRKDGRDNPTIGLLICKEKDRIQAQYALESSSQPIAISEYDLEKFYPEKLEGTMPTIEEIEAKLSKKYNLASCTCQISDT